MASSSAVELSAIDTRDFGEIERAVVAFARKPNGGLVVTASSSALIHRDQIIALATRLRERNAGCRGVPQDGHLGIEEENGRLRKVVADLTLDKEMLQEVIRRKL